MAGFLLVAIGISLYLATTHNVTYALVTVVATLFFSALTAAYYRNNEEDRSYGFL